MPARNASAPGSRLPTESDLAREPLLARQWAARITADDPRARAAAAAELAGAGDGSLPLLRRFIHDPDGDLRLAAFDAAYRVGPSAIPLLAEMLEDDRVSSRRQAADLLIDLAPDTESAQGALCRALKDEDLAVAADAARALGALGAKAGPSVSALAKALSHREVRVRLYAAEALASIGPTAAPATAELAELLHDPVPGVRWAACEGLASIGPEAAPAVAPLIEALRDESLYVRICAAGALGSIGPPAESAIQSLQQAARDPALHDDAAWAMSRITGAAAAPAAAVATAVPIVGRPATPSGAGPASPGPPNGSPPVDWDPSSGRNIAWSVELGHETFGRPVVADGVVYVGTDNGRHVNDAFRDECGVLMAFNAADGKFLWQDVAPRTPKRGLRDFLLPSTTSAPYVEGDRLYYLTAECQLRCLDTHGFHNGVNDGCYQDEIFRGEGAADIVWEVDLCARLGVFPHEACNSEVLAVGDLLIVGTSNGRNEGHTRVPSPRAPSLVAVDKRSGQVVWSAIGPGEHVLHGQWCSPVAATVDGRVQVLFGGGDGWLRAFDPLSGRELWRFDGNPKDAPWRPRPGVFSRGSIVAPPACDGRRVFIAMGEDPSHGDGPSLLHALSPDGDGDITDSSRLWTCRETGRVVATPAVKDGLLYVADLGGNVYCVDADTGAVVWKHETGSAVWGCLLLARDRLYVGNVEGRLTVLCAGRHKQLLAEMEMGAALYSRPALVGDTLYLATARRLYLIAAGRFPQR